MAVVTPGIELTPLDLQWKIATPYGVPQDVILIEYQIETNFDDGNPDQILIPFVSALTNRISTGLYFAKWEPPQSQQHGTHKIRWRWQLNSNSVVQESFDEFEVLNINVIQQTSSYITPANLYEEGVPRFIESSWLQNRIRLAQDYIERITGHFFAPRQAEYLLDGTGLSIIEIPHPIIEVTEIGFQYTLDDFYTYPLNYFAIYNRENTEDRFNPRIKVKRYVSDNIFNAVDFPGNFPCGTQNIKVVGTFGFVDENGVTPEPIKWATGALVQKFISAIASDAAFQSRTDGSLISETTDGHTYRLSEKMRLGLLTGDSEIDSILAEYSRGGSVGFA